MKILNEKLAENQETGFFERLYSLFAEHKVYPNEKERFLLNSLPNIKYAYMGLLAYKVREASGYMNAIFAFDLETQTFPLDFFNEYSLT